MTTAPDYAYFTGKSYSDLFEKDIAEARHAFILQYPSTAAWAFYPNTSKYYIQDGSREETKVGYDKLCQKEPWRNLSVLGDAITGVLVRPPRDVLLSYWRDTFGYNYDNLLVLERSVWCDYLNQHTEIEKLIMLFPHDRILPEKHAVDPDMHYHVLSKVALRDMGYNCPRYDVFDLTVTPLEDIELPNSYPYLIKTTHGLSGEGTYIIRRVHDVEYCFRELRAYLVAGTVREIIVSEFVKNEVANYCVQFYVARDGTPKLVGATSQLVSDEGVFQGGLIRYAETDMRRFHHEITATSNYLHKHGYFGMVGIDILEDRDGVLHVIDANIRVNGSTPLCLQRHTLQALGKHVAKYSSGYRMDGTLDDVLVALKPELDKRDLTIVSALEKADHGKIYCEIYGIAAGESVEELQLIETALRKKGLHSTD